MPPMALCPRYYVHHSTSRPVTSGQNLVVVDNGLMRRRNGSSRYGRKKLVRATIEKPQHRCYKHKHNREGHISFHLLYVFSPLHAVVEPTPLRAKKTPPGKDNIGGMKNRQTGVANEQRRRNAVETATRLIDCVQGCTFTRVCIAGYSLCVCVNSLLFSVVSSSSGTDQNVHIDSFIETLAVVPIVLVTFLAKNTSTKTRMPMRTLSVGTIISAMATYQSNFLGTSVNDDWILHGDAQYKCEIA